MSLLHRINRGLACRLIKDFDDTQSQRARVEHGLVAGRISIAVTITLFSIQLILSWLSGSISVLADAFHLVSHLTNAIILVLTFQIMSRPATAKRPFGYGRMEYVAPLAMSVFLFVSGFQLLETSLHQITDPHAIHFFPALPLILLIGIIAKEWAGSFVNYLGERVHSKAIHATGFHHRIDSVVTLTVIAGLMLGEYLHMPEIDGLIGILVAVWLLHLGYDHGHEAIAPLLGKPPTTEMIEEIRELATSVSGVEDVHEIIVQDYGTMYLISLHVEIPTSYSIRRMHGILEECETILKKRFGGEVVCHLDPLIEKTPETEGYERTFQEIIEQFPDVESYHRFRIIGESDERIIVVANLTMSDDILPVEYEDAKIKLQETVKASIPNVAYCVFNVVPKYAYS
ncbi:MAG: cation diffusion facilitator family transporter [Candidatus Thorarchaeota archaeon]